MTGDFFQLPPVTKGNEVPFFAFECEAWKKCIQKTVMLNKVFRQKDNRASLSISHPSARRLLTMAAFRICGSIE